MSVVSDKEAIIGRLSGQKVGRERQVSEPRERKADTRWPHNSD